jgi:hypothetical protein
MPAGNQPALTLTSSLRSADAANAVNVGAGGSYGASGNATVHVETNDGTTEREYCNAGGARENSRALAR